jgi:hypothetical protein
MTDGRCSPAGFGPVIARRIVEARPYRSEEADGGDPAAGDGGLMILRTA